MAPARERRKVFAAIAEAALEEREEGVSKVGCGWGWVWVKEREGETYNMR